MYKKTDSRTREELIEFNGMTFGLMNKDLRFLKFNEVATTRLEYCRTNIILYLNRCKEFGLEQQSKDGLIMIADDQFVVRQIMQVYLDELGLLNRVIFCKNGEEVVEYFKS